MRNIVKYNYLNEGSSQSKASIKLQLLFEASEENPSYVQGLYKVFLTNDKNKKLKS